MRSQVSMAVLALLFMAGTAAAQDKQQAAPQGSGAERSGGDRGGAAGGAGGSARGEGGGGERGQARTPERAPGAGAGEPKRQTQGPVEKRGPAAQGQSSGEGRQGAETKERRAAEPKAKEQRAQERREADRPGRSGSPAKDGSAASRDKDAAGAKEQRPARERTETQRQKQQQQRAQERSDDTTPRRDRASEGAGSGAADGAAAGTAGRSEGERPTASGQKSQPGQKDAERPGADRQRLARERAEISNEQRDRVRNVIREQRPRRARNINVEIEIGRRLPRTVDLRPLPRRVFEIVPAYRSYRYVYIDDRIAIVDPATYEVVYVIDEGAGPARATRSTQRAQTGGGGKAQQQAALQLTQAEREILFRYAEFDRAHVDVQFRLALGADVPERVELFQFPVEIIDRIPRLEPYRYVVVENRTILIVDPRDRQIELVVEPR